VPEDMDYSNVHQSQRGYFSEALYREMKDNPRIRLVVADLGYKVFDRHFQDFPGSCINIGASEQAGVGICVGMAQEGLIPFFYTISSFMLRAAETIGLYLHGEQVPVRLVGAGRDNDYLQDGISHDGTLAQNYLMNLKIRQYYPEFKEQVPGIVQQMVRDNVPSFISLRR
jgi:transketolase